jgi:hypothetical protein
MRYTRIYDGDSGVGRTRTGERQMMNDQMELPEDVRLESWTVSGSKLFGGRLRGKSKLALEFATCSLIGRKYRRIEKHPYAFSASLRLLND